MDVKNKNGIVTSYNGSRLIISLLKSKKAFVFSFLAFFLSIIIFAFGGYYLFHGDYTKDLDFKEARIKFLNNEVTYFKKVYVVNCVSFATHSSMLYLVENKTLMQRMNNNYSAMNSIMQEMIVNGSVDGVQNSKINQTSVNYLVSLFQNDFYTNYKGNFSYKINAINIYEEDPYYITIQVLGEYNITTMDNISSWNFNDSFKTSIPIYEFRDPEFTLFTGKNISIRYVDLYNSNINWTLDTFNESLVKNYSSIYIEPTHKYTVGTSFLNRLLNVSTSSYKNVNLFYSFDYDEYEAKVYDTSLDNNAKFYGNTKVLFNFNNLTVNGNTISDLTDYNNSAFIFGDVSCSVSGINDEGCSFDGNGDYINYNISSFIFSSNFSVSLWFKTNFSGPGTYRIIRHNDNIGFDLYLSGSSLELIENENPATKLNATIITDNSWNNVIVVFSNNTKYLYLNGVLIGYNPRIMTVPNRNYMIIGSHNGASEFFNGSIDEFAIYSKVLTNDEISALYKERKAISIDYKESLYGKGVEFDGIDDYVNITPKNEFNLSMYTIEFWIKPYMLSDNPASKEGILNLSNSSDSLRFFLNGVGKIEYDLVPADIGNLQSNFSINEWQYFTIVSDGTNVYFYKNSKLQDSKIVNMNFNNLNNIQIGFSANGGSTYFNGIVDEIKIYNRTLNDEEITQNYYNYDSKAKGCCNYITLINPTTMGYNTLAYNNNVSYNSKLFFNYYNKSIYNNITLWNLSNITSTDISKDYYNFIFDDCMMQAYSVYTFDYYAQNVTNVFYNDSCSNYVREGIY